MLTEQMLRRSPALAALNPVAAAHHERSDGSGYHKGLRVGAADPGARLLAAADVYVGLTSDRADRPAGLAGGRGAELPPLAAGGAWSTARDGRRARRRRATTPGAAMPQRSHAPGGLTRREVEVLRLAAAGLTTQADRRPALHLAEDRRPPHPARLHEDRGVDPRRRGAVGDRELGPTVSRAPTRDLAGRTVTGQAGRSTSSSGPRRGARSSCRRDRPRTRNAGPRPWRAVWGRRIRLRRTPRPARRCHGPEA